MPIFFIDYFVTHISSLTAIRYCCRFRCRHFHFARHTQWHEKRSEWLRMRREVWVPDISDDDGAKSFSILFSIITQVHAHERARWRRCTISESSFHRRTRCRSMIIISREPSIDYYRSSIIDDEKHYYYHRRDITMRVQWRICEYHRRQSLISSTLSFITNIFDIIIDIRHHHYYCLMRDHYHSIHYFHIPIGISHCHFSSFSQYTMVIITLHISHCSSSQNNYHIFFDDTNIIVTIITVIGHWYTLARRLNKWAHYTNIIITFHNNTLHWPPTHLHHCYHYYHSHFPRSAMLLLKAS